MKNIKDYNFSQVSFYKKDATDKIFIVSSPDSLIGEFLFTFDKITIFSFFADYPQNLTKEQKAIFDKENPYWAERLSPI